MTMTVSEPCSSAELWLASLATRQHALGSDIATEEANEI